MHVLVSGSSGLIGTALLDALAADGHRTTRLVRARSAPGPGGDRATEVSWDPTRHMIDTSALESVGPLDGVVHLAGAGVGDRRWSPARKRDIRSSRTEGTELLATTLAALASPPPALVSSSAVGYYGDRGEEVLTEESTPGTGFLAGAGESQLELDRRRLADRAAQLRRQLRDIAHTHELRLAHRRKVENLPVVAVVGYTNVPVPPRLAPPRPA